MFEIKSLFMITIFSLILSCGVGKKTDIDSGSFVKIMDHSGQPLEAANINIEIWIHDLYDKYTTDSEGLVFLPEKYLGKRAEIYKNNYYSQWISLKPGIFILEEAPQTFLEVGSIDGEPIKMDNKHIMTVTHLGEYHLYSYDKENVIEQTHFELPSWGKHTCSNFRGDTLWYAVIRDGIYIFDLSDPFSKVQIGYLPYEGWLFNIANLDSILVFESFDLDKGAFLHFCYYNLEGDIKELNVVEKEYTDIFHSVSGYLITRNERGRIDVIDYRDPRNIDTVSSDLVFEGCGGYFQGDTLVLKEVVRFGNDICGFIHHLMDFSNPDNPIFCKDIKDKGSIEHIVDKSMIICGYESGFYDLRIKRAKYPGEYETIGIISEQGDYYFYHPPYLVCGRKVWRLLDATE